VHLGISIQPFAADVTSGVSGALWLLFAAAGAVLLIACANLANLQLARAVSRERETAVRAALGASRLRLIWSRLMESFVLALIGGSAGVLLSNLGVKLLLAVAPANVPRIHEVQVNWMVLTFAAVLSVTTAFLFGILPALRSLRASPQQAMQASGARTTDTREGAATRSLLVASEIACAVVLLIVTGLALRSFSHLLRQGRSFHADHLTLAEVDLYAPQYGDSNKNVNEIKLAFIDRVLDAFRQLPGVQAAAISSAMPLTGETWIDGTSGQIIRSPKGNNPM
jgi:FtsX-like permease family